jgi:transposase, IS5 family
VLRTVCVRPTLWEVLLPPEALVMPPELVAVDVLLDDPRFFEPFRRWFDPTFGRPSIPMETYLRLMFLKYRYRLGYESLCVEVSDSLTWLRFCRIPLGERAPHPSTLMKITTRCGSTTVAELNAHLVAVGVEAGVIDMGWLRADTTVVPADIKYPTDSGLLTKGITRIAAVVARLQAAGIAPRTEFDNQTAIARQGAHRIGSKLRRRTDDAKAEVLVITGELADLAETAVEQARRVLVNGQRMGERPVKRLRRMLADLAHLIDAVTQVIAQTRLRLAGETPAAKTRRVSLHDDDARPIRQSDHCYRCHPPSGHRGPGLRPNIGRRRPRRARCPPRRDPPQRQTRQSPPTNRGRSRVRRTRQMAHRRRGQNRSVETPTRMGTSPPPQPRGRTNLVRLGRPQPQRDQDRRPHPLTPPATNRHETHEP